MWLMAESSFLFLMTALPNMVDLDIKIRTPDLFKKSRTFFMQYFVYISIYMSIYVCRMSSFILYFVNSVQKATSRFAEHVYILANIV